MTNTQGERRKVTNRVKERGNRKGEREREGVGKTDRERGRERER